MAIESSRITNMEGRLSISPEEEYRIVYRISTDVASSPEILLDDASDIFTATPEAVPRLWTAHPDDPGVICSSLECSPESKNNWTRWLITATYTIPPDQTTGGGQPGGPPEPNPLLRPVRYSLEFEKILEAVNTDIVTGETFKNSAKQAFPPVEVERSIPVLTAVKNYATLDAILSIGVNYDRSVNNAPYRTYGPRQARLLSITSSQLMYENGIEFYEGTLRIGFDPKTWDLKLLQAGWEYLDAEGKLTKFVDNDNQEVTDKKRLDADGRPLADGLPDEFATYQIYTPKDYSALNV